MTNSIVSRLAPLALAVLGLAATSAAQSISVPEGTLPRGSSVDVTFSDPEAAGQTVYVTVDNGESQSVELRVELNDEGRGTASWVVPKSWFFAVFSAPDAAAVTRVIT